jgi:hypothetical protein
MSYSSDIIKTFNSQHIYMQISEQSKYTIEVFLNPSP